MHENTETLLDRFYAKPKLLILIIAVISIFFGLQLPRIQIDNNNFNFIPKNNPARILNDEVAEIFGVETPILLGVERSYNSVFERDFILALRTVENELSAMDGVKRIVSVLNTPHLEGQNGGMSSSPLIADTYEGTPAEIETVMYKLRDWNEMYARNLVSNDGKALQFVIFLNIGSDDAGSPEAIAVCRKLLDISKNWNYPDSRLYVTGAPVLSEMVNQATAHDLALLIPIVVLVVIAVLFISFRHFLGVALPLLTVVLSVDWAIGAMALCGIKLSILSTVLPVILVALGSAYGIHVISHYFDERTQGRNDISAEEHKAIIISVMRRIMWPVFLAALTTFAGFVSFCFTSVVPIFHFGLFASIGVMSAFFIAIAFIPSILIVVGPNVFKRKKRIDATEHERSLDAHIAKTFMIIVGHKRIIIALLFIVLAGAAYIIRNIVIDNVLVEYFKNDPTVADADNFVRKNFAGSKELALIIKSDKENVVTRSDVLVAVDNFAQHFTKNYPEVGKVTSLSILIKRMNQVLNADAPAEGLPFNDFTDDEEDWGELGSFEFDTAESSFEDDFTDFSFLSELDSSDEYSQESQEPSSPIHSLSAYDIIKYLNEIVKEGAQASDMTTSELVEAIGRKLNYNGLAYYEIPNDPKKYGKSDMAGVQGLIDNYLMLLTSNIEGFVDNGLAPKVQKATIQLNTKGQLDTDRIVHDMQEYINVNFPKDVTVQIAGSSLVEQSLNSLVVSSQFVSLALSLAIVFVILAVYYKSVVAGIFGIIPLACSILCNFAIMVLFDIKINIGTALVASFAIGIGIDYTIHYLDSYHREIIQAGKNTDPTSFLYKTFYSSGKAILFNAISVGAGFAVLVFSDFKILSDLGFLICLVMIISSLASLTVLPVLLTTCKPRFIERIFKRDM